MTVSKDTTLCLRWNNDSMKLNLSEALQELRTDSDFFDVSLGCSKGSNTSSIRAHKVVLSAYSIVFKQMLRKLSAHNDPFIYLKGVSYDELSAMLDFMYHGEVYVTQANLNSFLSIAKELQIRGLTDNVKNPSVPSEKKVKEDEFSLIKNEKESKKSLNFDDIKAEIAARNRLRPENSILNSLKYEGIESKLQKIMKRSTSSEDSKLIQKISNNKEHMNDPLSTLLNKKITEPRKLTNNLFTKELLQKTIKEEPSSTNDLIIKEGEGPDNFTLVKSGFTSQNTRDFVHKMGKQIYMVNSGKKYRQLSKCRICSKEGRDDNINNHIKTAHPEVLKDSDDWEKSDSKSVLESLNNLNNALDNSNHNNIDVENVSEDGEDEEQTNAPLSIEDLYENLGKRIQGKHSRMFARCKICQKECRYDNIKTHIKNTHKEQFASLNTNEANNASDDNDSYRTVDSVLNNLGDNESNDLEELSLF